MTAYEYLVDAVQTHQSDECLLWPFKRDSDGYGRLRIPVAIAGKRMSVAAHRLAFKVINGRWPEPMGLHTCDTPACFNPRHIFEGTDQDNKDDQVSKCRQVRGTQQRDAKLTEETVAKARREYAEGKLGFALLAKKYGVSQICMRWAITGKNWKHVDADMPEIIRGPRRKDACWRGHPFVDGSFYVDENGGRQCKECTAIRARERKARLRSVRGIPASQVLSNASPDGNLVADCPVGSGD